ncbi:BnaCnng61230D [Brassica napus]|uniref:(rape) hypothetical protein n=1 Tax=Brassica napus TaxID=3708 RepID=A0A078JRC4_BRANA|nr:unnamed protein product [Brassica napus]CDY68975.1 BnaCnng61230D [Brassica napus]
MPSISSSSSLAILSAQTRSPLSFSIFSPKTHVFSRTRIVHNGTTIKFPFKNYYLLWMVETMNGSRSADNKRITSGQRRCDGVTSDDNAVGGMFPLVVIFLLVALYAIPVSDAVLGVYVFVTFALAVPSFLVLYFAVPSLNWLIREISA